MPCKTCGSDKQTKFVAEIAVHFPGPKNLDKPHILVFPDIVICLNCGSAEFTVPKSQLSILAKATILRREKTV